ncbi:MAG: hypothetical protein CMH57_04345 [Myxococcales bacterium]|nr:hypothetical protein [Myxococcales bacterium]
MRSTPLPSPLRPGLALAPWALSAALGLTLIACGGGIPGAWDPDAGSDEADAGGSPTIGDGLINAGWIGGPCGDTLDCHYDDAVCLGEGYPEGQCSLGCDRICPDRDGANSVTFCVSGLDGDGQCVSRCDRDLYPATGCRDGYTCQITPRHGEPGTATGVCLPDARITRVPTTTTCQDDLDAIDATWSPWDYDTQSVNVGGDALRCTVGDPIWLQSPIAGVRYRTWSGASPTMAVSCELALVLEEFGALLARHGIREVIHMGTFNCRTVSGTGRLSQHAHGKAIDIWGFVTDEGKPLVVEDDWEIDAEEPEGERGRRLKAIISELYEAQLFNVILTPDYNAAHRNHFHLDLTPGSRFLGSSAPHEACPGW